MQRLTRDEIIGLPDGNYRFTVVDFRRFGRQSEQVFSGRSAVVVRGGKIDIGELAWHADDKLENVLPDGGIVSKSFGLGMCYVAYIGQ